MRIAQLINSLEFGGAEQMVVALSLGLKRGDRVGIWSPNNPEWTLTQFATAKAGLTLVKDARKVGRLTPR